MSRKLLSFPALLALAAAPLLAQQADPPSRVARINLLTGSVSFRPGGVEEWTAASLNYPLTTGDHLWADADSRVEIHAGSTAIRMAPRTAMSVLNLDDRTIQLSLTDGSLHIRLRELADDESFEVDTPNVAITLLRAGEYRIDADGDAGATSVTVRSGSAQVTGGGTGFAVRPRQTGRATGLDQIQQDIGPALPQGEFDYWCEDRDRAEEQDTVSAQYVPRDMVGYEDLDRYGVWSEVPEYGPVWRPRTIDVGWAPYRNGHWAWVEPWGWTWIDDAPWGFAPFHYGRWAMAGGVWVWVPGRMVVGVRPVYAPALVVFVGTSRAGVAAWFPLGPREVYRPSYHVSDRYIRQVNITHVTNVTVVNNVYVNQRVNGATTVVTRDTFVGARHIGRGGMVAMDQREIGQGRVIGTAAPIAPERVSILAHAGPAGVRPPARVVERTVVVQRTPPPPPVSFEARRSALQANQGRPLDAAQLDRVRSAAPQQRQNIRMAPAAQGMPDRPTIVPRQERGPMGRPATQQDAPAQQQNQQPAQGGFRRFGNPQDRPAQPAPAQQPQVQQQQQPEGGRRFGRPQQETQPQPAPAQQPQVQQQQQPEGGRRFGRPQQETPAQPAPAPQPRVVDRPAPQDRPRPVDRPAPQDRPRPVDRPRPEDRPAPAAAPAPAPPPRGEGRSERQPDKRSERKERPSEEKKDK